MTPTKRELLRAYAALHGFPVSMCVMREGETATGALHYVELRTTSDRIGYAMPIGAQRTTNAIARRALLDTMHQRAKKCLAVAKGGAQ